MAVEAKTLDGITNGVAASELLPDTPDTPDTTTVAETSRAPIVEPQPDGKVIRRPIRQTSIYVQAGAFSRRDNAVRLGARLSIFGPTSITETLKGAQRYYRVRLGPVESVADADRLLANLLQNGHKDARVVVD